MKNSNRWLKLKNKNKLKDWHPKLMLFKVRYHFSKVMKDLALAVLGKDC